MVHNCMLALIRVSDTFYLVIPKYVFIPLIYSWMLPHPSPPTQNHYEVIKLRALMWDIMVSWFYGNFTVGKLEAK